MTGINFNTQKLRCMIILNDEIGKTFTDPGCTFFRGFVTEERDTGAITARFRFRRAKDDSWMELRSDPDDKRSKDEQVHWMVDAIVNVLMTGLSLFAGGAPVPNGAVKSFYPPNPDDVEGTLDWCVANDLMELKKVMKDGRTIPISDTPDKVM